MAHLTRRGLAKRSIARALSAVRSFYRWMHRDERVDVNPARAVGSPKLAAYLPRISTARRPSTLFAAGGDAREERRVHRRAQPRHARAVLLQRPAPVASSRHRPAAISTSCRSRSRCAARGARSASSRSATTRSARCATTWSKRDALLASSAARRRRARARRCVSRRAWQAHQRPRTCSMRSQLLGAVDEGAGLVDPLASPHVRDAHGGRRRRPARRPGAARPREHQHHADLHAHERGATEESVPAGAPAGVARAATRFECREQRRETATAVHGPACRIDRGDALCAGLSRLKQRTRDDRGAVPSKGAMRWAC